jgi:hypothetical protein
LVVAAVLAAPAARAESLESRERTARTSCLSGDYAKGAALLSELFVDTRNPTYIYNQGRCFEQNRRFEDAIGRFQEYLRVGRDLGADAVSDAKKHIADCKQLLGEQNGTAPRPEPPATAAGQAAVVIPAPSPAAVEVGGAAVQPAAVVAAPSAPAETQGRGLRVAGIIVGATGGAAIVAGVLLSLKANGLASDLEKLDGYTPDKESSRKTYRNLGLVGYGVGAAGLVTGGVLYFLGLRAAATQPSVAVSPLVVPGAVGAAMTGAF